MADLSRWLDHRGLGLAELSAARAEKFLCERRSKGHKRYVTPRAMEALLGYLRGLGLVPGRTAPAPQGPLGRLLGEFVEYLVSERALVPGTIEGYRRYAQWFLSEYAPGPTADGCGLDRLEVEQVTRFVLVDCCKLSVGATKNAVTALRVLMRFLFLEGYTPTCLVESVPRAIPWRDSGRSRALGGEQVSSYRVYLGAIGLKQFGGPFVEAGTKKRWQGLVYCRSGQCLGEAERFPIAKDLNFGEQIGGLFCLVGGDFGQQSGVAERRPVAQHRDGGCQCRCWLA
jgi:hypothetical protein